MALSVFDANVLRQDVRLASLTSSVADLVARCQKPRWLELDDQSAVSHSSL